MGWKENVFGWSRVYLLSTNLEGTGFNPKSFQCWLELGSTPLPPTSLGFSGGNGDRKFKEADNREEVI